MLLNETLLKLLNEKKAYKSFTAVVFLLKLANFIRKFLFERFLLILSSISKKIAIK